jgi:hypothetical protein
MPKKSASYPTIFGNELLEDNAVIISGCISIFPSFSELTFFMKIVGG